MTFILYTYIYIYLYIYSDNTEKIEILDGMKAPYLFTSLQLIQLCDTITSLKTKMEFIRLLGPRLIDPSSKVSTFLSMFRYNDDKQNVENILRTRQTSLIQSQFIMVENNNNNNSNNNINNSNSNNIKNNDHSNDGDHNNTNSPVKSTNVNARKSSSILSRRIVGGRGSSNRNSMGGSSTIITTTNDDAAAAAAYNDGIIDGSDYSITSSPTASPYASPSIAPTAEILLKEGSGIYDKNINFSNDNTLLHIDDISLSDLNDKDIQFSLLKVNDDHHHHHDKNSDAQKCNDIHNDVYLNDDNEHCFQVDYGDDDDNDVFFDSRPLASRSSNRQSLAWTNRLNSFVDNHY